MIWQLSQYVKHQWRAQGNHLLHSPFVFDFYRHALKAKRSATVDAIAQFSKELKRDKRSLTRTDFGAGHGGKGGGTYESSVAETARRSSRRRKEGALLHNLVKYYQPKRLLELGTHLGISSLYQASALDDDAQLKTLEGDPALAALAREHIQQFDFQQVEVIEGAFTETLPSLQMETYKPDFVFLDGDHRYQPTMDYVHAILPHMPNESILILDDIYWSKGMAQAWEEVQTIPELTVTIDLFFFGVAFVKRPQKKQHFVLR